MIEDLKMKLLNKARVIFSTLNSTGKYVDYRFTSSIDYLIIDEATQSTEI